MKMIRINLLPEARRPDRYHYVQILSSILWGCFLCLVLFYLVSAYRIHTLQTKLIEIGISKALLQPTAVNYELYRHKKQVIRQKEDVLIKLTQERNLFYTPVARLSNIIPNGVLLTSITSIDPETFRIIGIAESYIQLTLFLQKLHNDSMFNSTLNKIDLDSKTARYRFEIIGKIKGR